MTTLIQRLRVGSGRAATLRVERSKICDATCRASANRDRALSTALMLPRG
jgi:hypothetical protein